jgi:hypothetical protein
MTKSVLSEALDHCSSLKTFTVSSLQEYQHILGSFTETDNTSPPLIIYAVSLDTTTEEVLLQLDKRDIPYSKKPIFQRYIFFNNAVYLGLLTMSILAFITVAGVSILSGIQSPSRFEKPIKTSL